MPPKTNYKAMAQRLSAFAKYHQYERLMAYVQSDAFSLAFNALTEPQRRVVMAAYARTHEICLPPPAPGTPTKRGRQGRWTPQMIDRLHAEFARGGVDRVAAVLGLTIPAAKLAVKRYGATATTNQRQAA